MEVNSMAFCSKCGTQLDENANFCPSCGNATASDPAPPPYQTPPNQQYQQPGAPPNIIDTPDYTSQYHPVDIQNNKGISVLSYLGILFLIPMLAAKHSPFARFHVNQGMVLLIFEIGYGIVKAVILSLINIMFSFSGNPLYSLVSTMLNIAGLVFLVLTVVGIVNAANGKAKELPIIGKIILYK